MKGGNEAPGRVLRLCLRQIIGGAERNAIRGDFLVALLQRCRRNPGTKDSASRPPKQQGFLLGIRSRLRQVNGGQARLIVFILATVKV